MNDGSGFRRVAGLLVGVVLAGHVSLLGCTERAVISLVPVYPADEPRLLASAGVEKLVVTPRPANPQLEELPEAIEVAKGETLVLRNLDDGSWQIAVSGLDSNGTEVVYGETAPFEIAAGLDQTVSFFVGRTGAFNAVDLRASEAAAKLARLEGHTATPFVDKEGRNVVLIAGGRSGTDATSSRHAFIFNTALLEVEQLAEGMSCARAGHEAHAIDTRDGLRIVIGGGDDECPGTIEVFDPTTGRFAQQGLGCLMGGTTAGVVPEMTSSGTTQTGNVVAAGSTMCVFDPIDGKVVRSSKLEGPTPVRPVATAVNQRGQLLIASEGALFADYAWEDLNCYLSGTWEAPAIWKQFATMDVKNLIALRDDSFLVTGRSTALEEGDAVDWAVIGLPFDCGFERVVAGTWVESIPQYDFAPIELEQEGEVIALMTGGRENAGASPTDGVSVFRKPFGTGIGMVPPIWYDPAAIAGADGLGLTAARAGHAVAEVGDGNVWLFGGRDGESRPVEVFVRGSRHRKVVEHREQEFNTRSPGYTVMNVIDTTQGADTLINAYATFVPKYVYGTIPSKSLLFLVANADQGIGEGLLGDLSPDAGILDRCENIEIDEPTEWVGVTGDKPGDTEVISPGGEAPVGGFGASAQDLATDNIRSYTEDPPGCDWRQLLRVGLGGLEYGGIEEGQERSRDRLDGPNLLFIATAGDGCSQGIFPEQGPISDVEKLLLECDANDNDEYFKIPLVGSDRAEFESLAGSIAWDVKDLFVVIFGNVASSGEDSCSLDGDFRTIDFPNPLVLRRPRRLLAGAEELSELGVTVIKIDLCDNGIYLEEVSLIEQGLESLVEPLSRRNYLETCVPTGLGIVPFTGAAEDPPISDTPESAAATDAVKSRCRVVGAAPRTADDSVHDAVEYWRIESVIAGYAGWIIESDPGSRHLCENDWLLTLENHAGEVLDHAAIVCME